MKKTLYILLLAGLAACGGPDTPSGDGAKNGALPPPKSITFSVTETFPHDTSAYTEGLLFYKGKLYESTGLPGKSRIVETDLKTGKVLRSVSLDAKYFGEGIVIVNDTIYQLTYREKVGFMYSVNDFKKLGEFSFASPEGWGMTTDGKQIIASDGTSNLYYYEPGTFRLLKTQSVTESGSLSYNINELEYIDGFIYANQWQTPYILQIDPESGVITGKIDFSTITNQVKAKYPYAEFFNGIAYDSTTKKVYVTGKNWPEMYSVELSR